MDGNKPQMTDAEESYLAHRVRYLPRQIEDTRHKFVALLREARRYGMSDLVSEAWDQVILDAQAEARGKGGSVGFGDGKR